MTAPVLVTGGCGFIGAHIVEALLAHGLAVRVVDAVLPAAHDVAPPTLEGDVEYLWGDVADPELVARAVAGLDLVCHQAAMVGLGLDFGDAPAYAHHNVGATAALLAALHDAGFAGRIVLASSMVVYGEGMYECVEHSRVRPAPRALDALIAGEFEPPCPMCGCPLRSVTIDEDAPTDPRNVYALTKLAQEHLGASYVREHPGCTIASLRYHNVYGPLMPRNTPYAGVASIFRSALERGEAPRVFEDGGQRRDFVHVRDVARANVLALTGATAYDGPLNVASGTAHTVLDLATALADEAGIGAPAPVVTGEWRPGDVRHVVASAERAAAAIGFSAEIAFADGMREFAKALLRA
ncbi:MAG: NAD-dependent epimerase/dehydratase family protein [Actinomycetota bacterium]